MLKLILISTSLVLLINLGSCRTYNDWYGPVFTVQTLSLFNQRTKAFQKSRDSWKGDWILRRKRLNLVDEIIKESSPNIVFFQELLAKDNKADSDAAILEYSSLSYHKPYSFFYKEYEDTGEKEFAANYILMGNYKVESSNQAKLEPLLNNGYMVFQKVFLDRVPFYLVNIKMGDGDTTEAFVQLTRKLKKHLEGINDCYNQIIVAGHFKGQSNHPSYDRFLRTFNLVDSAWKFCEMNKDCYTESPKNPLLSNSHLESKISRSERILTHKTSKIISSHVAFNKEEKTLKPFKEKYNLHTLTPSLRYGWEAKVSFGICLNRKRNNP